MVRVDFFSPGPIWLVSCQGWSLCFFLNVDQNWLFWSEKLGSHASCLTSLRTTAMSNALTASWQAQFLFSLCSSQEFSHHAEHCLHGLNHLGQLFLGFLTDVLVFVPGHTPTSSEQRSINPKWTILAEDCRQNICISSWDYISSGCLQLLLMCL